MEKIKQFIQSERGKDILTVIIVILVGLGSFMLGRLSNSSTDVKIENGDQNSSQDNNSQSEDSTQTSLNNLNSGRGTSKSLSEKNFFASSKGTKYYTINCSAGKTIKQENKIYFATGEAAQAAGYTLSSSCK